MTVVFWLMFLAENWYFARIVVSNRPSIWAKDRVI